jgi:hypothetical protein
LSDFALRAGQLYNTQEYVTHQYCKFDSLNLEGNAGGEVIAAFDWKGLDRQASGSALPQNLPPSGNKVMEWYNTGISGLTTDRTGDVAQVISWNARIENNTDWVPLISPSLAPDHIRAATYIREGIQRVTFGMRLLVPTSQDIAADALGYISSMAFILNNGAQSVTLTLYNLMPGAQERPMRPEELEAHGMTFSVQTADLS